jgi:hypothetical protein
MTSSPPTKPPVALNQDLELTTKHQEAETVMYDKVTSRKNMKAVE